MLRLTLCILAACLPALASAQSLATIDRAPLSAADLMSAEIGSGLATAALDGMSARGAWGAGHVATGRVDPDGTQGANVDSRALALGYTTGWHGLSPFIGYAQGSARFDDGRHEARIRSYFYGLGIAGQSGALDWRGALYMGNTHNVIDSPAHLTGDADFDGRLYGLALGGRQLVWQAPGARPGQGIDIAARLDLQRHDMEEHPVSGPSATVGRRVTTAAALRVELGAPHAANGHTLRPYAALTAFGGSAEPLSLATGTASRSLGAARLGPDTELAMGVTFDTRSRLAGRVELASGADSRRLGLTLGLSF